jgi:hypothetical protein
MNTIGGPSLDTDSWSLYASGTLNFEDEVEEARLWSVRRAA